MHINPEGSGLGAADAAIEGLKKILEWIEKESCININII